MSFINLLLDTMSLRKFSIIAEKGQPVDVVRNNIVKRFLKSKSDHLLFIDSVTGDTPLLIRRHSKFIDFVEIQELFKNDHDGRYKHVPSSIEVMTRSGWKKILYVYKHTVSKPIYKLTGEYVAKITPDHSLFIDNNLVSGKNIKIGQKLDCTNFLDRNNFKNMTLDLAKLLGFFCGDGTCGIYPKSFQFKLSNMNLEFLKKYKKIIEEHFCTECYLIPDKHNVFHLTVRDKKEITKLFRKLCYTNSGQKKIPISILNSNKRIIESFLEGFYEADGAKGEKYQKGKIWSVDSNSYILIAGLEYLNKKLGYRVTFIAQKNKPSIINISRVWQTRKKSGVYQKNITYPKKIEVYDIGTEDGTFVGGCGQIIFKNSDMTFPKDLIQKLLKVDADISSALAFKKWYPHYPAIYKKKGEKYEHILDYAGPRKIIDVAAVGMACCLIKRKVFEEIKTTNFRWFNFRHLPDGSVMSEDLNFCRKATEAGFKIKVYTGLVCGHVGGTIDDKTFLGVNKLL